MKLLTTIKNIFDRKSVHRNAQGMAEFALVMPLLLLVVYGLFEVGRLIFIYSNVITAARVRRCGMDQPPGSSISSRNTRIVRVSGRLQKRSTS